jgi:hypothetical protein
MRQVFISDYRNHWLAARTYAQTDDFKLDMKRRAGIERIIACLTRYHGARRARRRGLPHADFQAKLSAVAFNLKQWLKLLRHRQVVRGQLAAPCRSAPRARASGVKAALQFTEASTVNRSAWTENRTQPRLRASRACPRIKSRILQHSPAATAKAFIVDPGIVTAIRLLNLRLMKKGPCVYGRFHCMDLADRVVGIE